MKYLREIQNMLGINLIVVAVAPNRLKKHEILMILNKLSKEK